MFQTAQDIEKRDIRISIVVSRAERDFLTALTAETGMSITDIIRVGLQHVKELHDGEGLSNA